MLLLLALALGHGLLATLAMDEKSTTSDEIAHITGGYTFNHWNDYRLHPENGLLPQRWQSLPMVLAGAKYPNQSGQDWATSHVWMLGYVFFYQEGNNLEWMLATARAMNACFGLATVLLVAWWAWHFFAGPGAIVAAVLCVLSPSMLAHSGLATSDMAMTFFLLAAASAWWWHLHDGRRRVWLLSAVSFGLACVAKYTAVLLLPIFTLMMIVRTVSSAPLPFFGRTFPTRLSRLGVMTASLAGQGLVAVLVIWAFCGFRYVAFNPVLPPGDFIVSWDHVLSIGSAQADYGTFAGTAGVFLRHHYDKVLTAEDAEILAYAKNGLVKTWGVFDEDLYGAVVGMLQKGELPQPFLLTIATTDTHFPYATLRHHPAAGGNSLLDSIYSADVAFGVFWDYFKNSPYFQNTLLVVVADHALVTRAFRRADGGRRLSQFDYLAGMIHIPGDTRLRGVKRRGSCPSWTCCPRSSTSWTWTSKTRSWACRSFRDGTAFRWCPPANCPANA